MRPPGGAPFLPERWWDLTLTQRRAIAGALVILLVVAGWVLFASGGSDEPDGSSGTPTDAEQFVADLPPERVQTWDDLAQCESSGDWSANTGNGFYGGLQFTQSSWEAVGGTGNPADASRDEQIMRAEMLQSEQGWGAWPVCSRRLGLG